MPRVWKLEVFSTSQYRILVLQCGSIKENLLMSLLRKSRQIWLVTKLEKLYGSDGYQTLRSLLTVLPLLRDLTHGSLIQFHLILWIILTSSCLTNGFFRLIPWSSRTPCCLTPILPLFFKLPGFLIPLDLSSQRHTQLPRSFFVFRRLPSVFLSTPSHRHQTSLVSRHGTNSLSI